MKEGGKHVKKEVKSMKAEERYFMLIHSIHRMRAPRRGAL
jgi:hypothetical protein